MADSAPCFLTNSIKYRRTRVLVGIESYMQLWLTRLQFVYLRGGGPERTSILSTQKVSRPPNLSPGTIMRANIRAQRRAVLPIRNQDLLSSEPRIKLR